MDAKPLYTEDKKDIVAHFCGECRLVKKSFKDAEDCCIPKLCKCGNEE